MNKQLLMLFFCISYQLPLFSQSGAQSTGISTADTLVINYPAFDIQAATHPEYGLFKSPSGGDELIQEREECSKLFLNADGSYSKQTGLLPLHYKDELGNWRTYINEVENNGAGKFGVFKTDLPIAIDAVTGKTVMQLDRTGNAMEFGQYAVMTNVDENGNQISSFSMGDNYETMQDSNTLTIHDAWAGVDRKQSLSVYQVETDYIINQAPQNLPSGGEVLFTEKVQLPKGWSLTRGEGTETATGWKGELLIKNREGEVKGKFELPYYYDSNADRQYDDQWTEGEYRYHETEDGITLSVAVKADWLLSPHRVYPVIIDPTASGSLPQYGNVRGDYGYASTCQQTLNVNVPANSYVTNVNSQYYMYARNGAWRNEQRSHTGGPTGWSGNWQGCCSSGGGQFYNYNAANMATGYYSGNITFTWQAYGTWPGSSNAYCGTYYHYRYSNWVVTVTYTSPCYASIDDRTILANGSAGPITVCQGATVAISSNGGNTTNWCYWISSNGGSSWNILGGGNCNQASFNRVVNTAGTWLFHVRNSDACGYCWDIGRSCESCGTCIVTVNVQSPPTAPTSITGTNLICNGQSTTLTASGGSNGSGATYQWYAGGCGSGSVLGTGVSLTVSPASTTTYYVRRVGNTSCTTTTGCASRTVTVNTPPTAPTSITGTASICSGSSTTLTASGGSNGSGATYQWYAGGCGSGGVLGTGVSLTVSPSSTTTYYVRRVGNSPCNGTVTACASRTVTVTPAATANAGPNISQCGTTAYVISGATATNYSAVNWATSIGSGTATFTNLNTLSPTITPTSATGSVTMTLTSTANSPCTNVSDAMVFSWVSTPTANAGPNQNNCGGANFYFSGASASTPSTWSWTLQGGGSGTGNLINGGATLTNWGFDPTSASGSRTIRLSVTGTGGCGSTTVTDDIVVSWAQTPTVSTTSPQNNCNNNGAAFTIAGASAGGSYSALSWSLTPVSGTGSITAGGTTLTPTFDPSSSSGQYTLTLQATGSSYCTGTNPTSSMSVIWVPQPAITTVGAATSTCGTDPHPMTGAAATGTYSSVAWTGGAGNGTWSNTSTTDPAQWTFTPNAGFGASGGSFPATLTVTGSGICSGNNPTATRTITIAAPPTANAGSDIISCNGPSPISMTGASATNYNTYAWSGGASEGTWNQGSSITNAQFIPGVQGGQFTATLLVTRTTGACAGRTASDTRDILFVPPPSINSIDATDVTDCNNFNGFIYVDASGYEPLTYSSDNGATYQSENFFENLPPGNYNIRVKNNAGCVTVYASNPVTINPAATVTATVTVTANVTCGGGNNGIITISNVSGGSPDYEYSIVQTGGTPDSWITITTPLSYPVTGLFAGTFDIVVRDRFGCESVIYTKTITQPTALTITNMSITDIAACGGTGAGAITVTATGGTGAKTFYLNSGSSVVDNTSPFTATWNNLVAGTYSVEVRDANSCIQLAEATINAPWVPNAGNDIQICSGSSVQLQGSITGQFPTNCAPVCQSNCGMPGGYCAASASDVTREWLQKVGFSTMVNDWTWDNTYSNYTGTSAVLVYRGSNYTLSAQVKKCCSNTTWNEYVRAYIDWNRNGVFEASEYYNVGNSTANTANLSINVTVPAGASLGRTRLRVFLQYNGYPATNGCGNITYGEVEDYSVDVAAPAETCTQVITWSPGGGTGYTPTVTPASTTTYTMTIDDDAGCIQNSSVTVSVSNQASPTTATVNNVSCNGANDGCATINATGGIAPYILKKGTTFQIYGGKMEPVTINNTNGTLTNMEVKISVAYTASMRSDFGDLRFFDASLNKLSYWIESYTLSGTAIVWVKIPSLPTGNTTIYMTFGNNALTTAANGDGVFDFFDDFNYFNTSKWTRGTIAGTTGTDWSNYGGFLNGANTNRVQTSVATFSGNYISEGRVFESGAVVNGFTTLGFYGSASNGWNILSHNGTNYVRNDGGWPNFGATSPNQMNGWMRDFMIAKGAGSNAKRTRESNGSTITYTANNSGLSSERVRIGARGDNSATNQNFAAQWDFMFVRTYAATEPTITVGAVINSDNSFCGLAPGAHTVNVVDMAGCTRTVNFNITQPTVLTVSATFTPITCYAPLTGAIDLSPSGGTPAYGYNWAGPGGFSSSVQDPTVTQPGTYNITVSDQNTCTITSSVDVTQLTPIESPFHTWKGTVNTLWQQVGNWDCGIVPVSTSRVIIPAAPVGGNLPNINAGINAHVYDIELRGNTVNLLDIISTGTIEIHKP